MINLLFKIAGLIILLTSVSLYGVYLLSLLGYNFLPGTTLFSYYGLATFGAAGLCWSWLLLAAQHNSNQQLLLTLPSALGFGLLGLMRLLTLTDAGTVLAFLPNHFAIIVAASEAFTFSVLAVAFFQAHKTLKRSKSAL